MFFDVSRFRRLVRCLHGKQAAVTPSYPESTTSFRSLRPFCEPERIRNSRSVLVTGKNSEKLDKNFN